MSEAVAEAERRTGGRVLSADPREDNGQLYYRVKVLTPNGRVQMLHIDAR
ncbi:MAG: PepSY domain-containing protein [Gammaproteobacteria bacterium]